MIRGVLEQTFDCICMEQNDYGSLKINYTKRKYTNNKLCCSLASFERSFSTCFEQVIVHHQEQFCTNTLQFITLHLYEESSG